METSLDQNFRRKSYKEISRKFTAMGDRTNRYLIFFEGDYKEELGKVVWNGKEYFLHPFEVFETLSELREYIHKTNEYWDEDYEELMNEGYKCFLISASVEAPYTEFDVEIFENCIENVQTHENIVYCIWMKR